MVGKIAAPLVAMASVAAALSPLSVKGNSFVTSSGQSFDIVGVAYQPGGSAGFNPSSGVDPLSDSKACLRDATLMQKLGVNAIRVYNLDPAVSHDECAGIFDAAGIRMLIDVNSPLQGQSLDAAAPWTTYTKAYLQRVFQVIEAFKGYPNLIGFFSGNEVINDVNSGQIDPPYIRAVTRDMKNYIAKNSPARAIPVGYSAADVRQSLVDTSNYLQCSMDDNSNIDFFGLNSYSWCGDSNPQQAGYDVLTQDFSNSSVPVFFSEYGCNAVTPRPFTEVEAIYSQPMDNVFMGGLVYEWTQETNNFGLVKIASDGSAQLLTDYNTLQTQFAKVRPNINNGNSSSPASNSSSSSSASAPQKCSASLISGGDFDTNFTLPAVPDGVQDMIDNGVQTGFAGGRALAVPTATACPYPVTDTNNQPVTGLSISSFSGNTSVSSSYGNSTAGTFNQINGTDSGSSSGSAATTLSSAVATATPPAPPISAGGSSSSGSKAQANAAASGSASPSSSGVAQSNGAVSVNAMNVNVPAGVLAAMVGIMVL